MPCWHGKHAPSQGFQLPRSPMAPATTTKMAGKEGEASPFDQLCFTGESSCNLFRPHFLKPNMCTSCMKEISKHTKEAVPSEECVLKALEHTQKGLMVPSLILEKDEEKNYGAIFLGGFKAAINPEFLKKENVTHILNVAGKGLGILFGPKYRELAKTVQQDLGITTLNLDWEDNMKFHITEDDFKEAICFIANGRKSGAVLIHCAQGKSRSGTALCAYLMATQNMKMLDSVELVQERRKMVDPNPNFRILLIKFEKSEMLARLREELGD